MTGRALTAVLAVVVLVGMSLVGSTAQAAGPGNGSAAKAIHGKLATGRLSVVDVCSASVAKNVARCYAKRVVSAPKHGIQPNADAPTGYSPADLVSAYNLPANGGAGATIGIVDAYDNPNALADLTVYRAQYGLPALTAGQFKKVNQRGVEGSYPAPDPDWAGEIALDIDMVSAIAPNANIVLVEADAADLDSLGASVNQAVALGATYVSNSYGSGYTSDPGSGEDPSELQWTDAYYSHPGVAVVASSGDDAYGVSYPAASAAVTSVGGTALVHDAATTRGWSESVWNNEYGGPGSGCSLYEPKPAFQTDTGCAMRAENDVSAVADPATGVAVYNTYGPDGTGWAQYGGTSASSPIIAATYALGGAIPAGTSPNSFPYAKPGALNDVSTGANGTCSPSYLCTAGTGWDGPTGLGTPNGTAAFKSGPHGFVTGTVTDAGTGDPVTGATVSAGDATATTSSATTSATGTYVLLLDPGTYAVTTAAYGYATTTVNGVVVTDGATVTRNFALATVPRVTLSGNVTDGSGHAWPVYARISLDGVPGGAVYTNPLTGHFSVDLPRQRDYTLHVDANYPGYVSQSSAVHVGTTNVTRNVSLEADPLQGSAPGYGTQLTAPATTFDSTTAPPAGWTVTNDTADGGWAFDDPGNRGNLTGGTGGFAIVDSDNLGADTFEDSVLAAPAADFTGKANPVVDFRTDYKSFGGQTADVDYSIDGGATWLNAWHTTTTVNGEVRAAMPAAAGKTGVLVRFHFIGSFGYWWQLDDIKIGGIALTLVNGGLIAGNVTDANAGAGIIGATVTDTAKPTENASTVATPDDPNLGDGFYWFFATGSGARTLSAHKAGYTDSSTAVTLQPNYVVKGDVALPAGRIAVSASGISKTVKWHGQASTTLTFTNTGTAAATVKLGEQPGGMTIAAKAGAKQHRVKAAVSLHRLAPIGKARAKPGAIKARPDVSPSDAPWVSAADLPVATQDNIADVDNGILYSGFGYNGSVDTSEVYAYDATSASWSKKASAADTREAAAHAFIGGKWYVTGGWGTTGDPDAKTEVYDPATDSWTTAAANPNPLAGSASAVIGGKLYVLGGCTFDSCGSTAVEVYDPATDSWSNAAAYPELVSWESCGSVGDNLYCAGGASDANGSSKHGYAYSSATDSWNPIADLPIDMWGSAYAAANGQLLIVDGVTNDNADITNQGFAYDPGTDAWAPLPNANTATYRGAGALGFYKVGGSPGGQGVPPVTSVEVLPGFDQGGTTDVTWLSENTPTFTIAPGHVKKVEVTLDADVPEITQPGTFTASISVVTTTPYPVTAVPVALTVKPPATWGKVLGTVFAKAADGSVAPLPGATVEIDSWASQYTLKTSADGTFALWLDARNSPLTFIAAKDGLRPQTRTVAISAGKRTTVNFTLVKP